MIHSISHSNIAAENHMSKSEPSPRTRQQIDENLKRVFQEQVEQELPDRFKDLLTKLQEQEASKKSQRSSK